MPKGSICPRKIRMGWQQIPPYLIQNTSNDKLESSDHGEETTKNISGVIVDVISHGIAQCCRNNITMVYEEHFTDIINLVQASVNSSLDIVLPLRTDLGKTSFITFPYVGLGSRIIMLLKFS